MSKSLIQCRICGKQAFTEEDLKQFRKSKQAKLGYLSLCNKCRNKSERPEYHRKLEEINKLASQGLKKCSKCKEDKPFSSFYRKYWGYTSICKVCIEKSKQEWREGHRELTNLRNKKYQPTTSQRLRIKAISILTEGSMACANPFGQHKEPYTDPRALTIDHIKGDGALERKTKKWVADILCRHIVKDITPEEARKHYQVLCANCNWIKRVLEKKEGGGWNAKS